MLIFANMRPLTYIPRYTVEDYRRWEGDWELIDGIPYAMSPSPIIKHQVIGGSLFAQIREGLKKPENTCNNCVAVYEVDWVLDNSTVLRPDVAIICNNKGDFISTPPVLVIEVLSPSTALKDQHVKFGIYEEQGVKYYIIVDPKSSSYVVYLLVDGKYAQQSVVPAFVIHDGCTIQLDIEGALAEVG